MLQVVEVEYLPDVAIVCDLMHRDAQGYLVAILSPRAIRGLLAPGEALSICPKLRFLPMGDYSHFVTVCEERGLELAIV